MGVPFSNITFVEIVQKGIASAQGSDAINIINVWHFGRNQTTKPLNKANIEDGFDTTIGAKFLLCVNASYTQVTTSIRFIEDPTDAPYEVAESGVGNVAGDRFPPFNSAYLLLRSTLRGRSYRGSKHIGPMSESDTTTGTADVWNAATLTRLGSLAASIAGGFSDSDANQWTCAVVSQKLSNYQVTPCVITASAVATVLVNKRIGTMRRRSVRSVY